MLRRTLRRARALLAARGLVLGAIAVAVFIPADFVFAAVDTTRLWGDLSVPDLTIGVAVYSLPASFANAACVATLGDKRLGVADSIWTASRRVATVLVLTVVMCIGIGLGILALVVPGVVLLVWWWVAYQATMLEGVDWRRALGRSRELARGHFWQVLVVVLSSAGAYGLVEYVLVLKVGNALLPEFWSAWLMGGLTDVVTLPVGVAVTTALYVELAQTHSSAPDPTGPLRSAT